MKTLLMVVLLAVIAVALLLWMQARKASQMSPPVLIDGALPVCGSKPNCVSSTAGADSSHYIEPIRSAGATMQSVVAAIEALGGQIQTTDANSVTATFASTVFGFIDDLIVTADSIPGTFQVRSSSRVGYSDMGANRKRVEQLRTTLGKP